MLRRELAVRPHPDLPSFLERAQALAKRLGPTPDLVAGEEEDVVLCGKLPIEDSVIRTMATVMRFDKPLDVTVAELRVELIFPADDAAEEFFRGLAR